MNRLTDHQRRLLKACIDAGLAQRWYRAATTHHASSQGERVTLANLFHQGLLERQQWRGGLTATSASYEYRATPFVLEVWGMTEHREGAIE